MPQPVVEPMPPSRELRFSAPDDEQEASYFAASARISSFCWVVSIARRMPGHCVLFLFLMVALSSRAFGALG